MTYSLSPTSTVLVDVSVERLRDYVIPNVQIYYIQDVYLNSLRFEHKFLEKNLTLALEYRQFPGCVREQLLQQQVIGEVMMQF